jgi:hypothetical protein
VRIGLTRAQVNAIRNPRLSQGIEVKLSDSRARAYIEEYGNRCWETDVLPAATIESVGVGGSEFYRGDGATWSELPLFQWAAGSGGLRNKSASRCN